MTPVAPIFESEHMRRIKRTCEQIAGSDVSVLISGETGTGKEVIADLIHSLSKRSAGPCIKVNCAAIAKDLFDSEMFGHKKGAFTGAVEDAEGLFMEAHGGTIVLDELTECSSHEQAKLLRVLQTRQVRQVGRASARGCDVRVIAITNSDVRLAVQNGKLREDVFFRVAGIQIELKPLRARTADILPMAQTFLTTYARVDSRPVESFSEQSLANLKVYEWPGNVRELQNAVRRAVLLSDGPVIMDYLLPAGMVGLDSSNGALLATQEKHLLIDTLGKVGGNKLATARILGLGRQTVYNKMVLYGIPANFGRKLNGHHQPTETT